MKVNANFRLFAGVNFDSAKYIPSPAYGVDRFMLDRIGTELARATTIVKYAPNSKFPKHTHIGGEEFLVLEGTFKDQFGEFPAGTYVRNPIGSEHAPWVDQNGCTIFVKLLQMAETGEGTTSLYVNLDKAKEADGIKTVFGIKVNLYKNSQTGECVQMLWVDKNAVIPTDELCMNGGEELFVVTGSLVLDNIEDEYATWGWLRFPVGSDDRRPTLRAGSRGAQVYRKTGHLTDGALSMEKIQVTEED
jgi:hypothetical protein